MNKNETVDKFLAADDLFLAEAYSEWSERFYCAGWFAYGEQEFVRHLLGEDDFQKVRRSSLKDYEKVSIAKIRRLLQDAKNTNEKVS